MKNVSELSSTTHHYYNADSCGMGVSEHGSHNNNNNSSSSGNNNNNGGGSNKELMMDTASCQNDSDEDVIVDDDETVKMTSKLHGYKRRHEENVGSSR